MRSGITGDDMEIGRPDVVFTERAHISKEDCIGDDTLWSLITFKIMARYKDPIVKDTRLYNTLLFELEKAKSQFRSAIMHFSEDNIASLSYRELKAFLFKDRTSLASYTLGCLIRVWSRLRMRFLFGGYNRTYMENMVGRIEASFMTEVDKLVGASVAHTTSAQFSRALCDNCDELYAAAISPLISIY